jgi:phosphatidylglycerol:prolipoprotein diacylglycerol transferase
MFPWVKVEPAGLQLFVWIYLVGVLAHFVLVTRRYRKDGLPLAHCMAVYGAALVLAAIGAKTYELIDNWYYYRHNPGEILSLSGHGWNGVFSFSVLGLAVLFMLWGKPTLKLLDGFVYYFPIAISIGRIGCLITADGDYGTPTSLPWGMTFKYGYFPIQVPVHPTPLYEIIVMIALYLLLRSWVMGKMASGWVLAIYLWCYSVQRFLIEFIRWNRPFAYGLTLAQWACIAYFLVAAVLAAWLLRRGRIRPLEETLEESGSDPSGQPGPASDPESVTGP